jgi:hypothetical protein
MGMGSTIAKGAAGLLVLALVGGGGAVLWASSARDAVMAKTWEIKPADFPVPFPLTEDEVAALRAEKAAKLTPPTLPDGTPVLPVDAAGELLPPPDPLAGVDLEAVALERAAARGKHLMFSRLGCPECHGEDLAGGVMIDAPPMGQLLGSNITSGGVTKGWGPADWDRIVRHGVMHDGHTAVMPAEDYHLLSDRELSDVIAYARSVPASDAVVPAPWYGPVMTMLIATENIRPAAYKLDHSKVPPRVPPAEAPDAAYGAHLAQTCMGCHAMTFAGGPIDGGDPSWPPAANLTPTGTKGWTWESFDKALRQGVRHDGEPVRLPMPSRSYASLTELESKAMWAFLQTVPAAETGAR